MTVSIVEVGMAVGGGFVGTAVAVGWICGVGAGVQAVRKNKKAMMSFFMVDDYILLQEGSVVE
jgi:F0F1-type ATP synthase membrane subunit c/vacuolar-type H+-ATPase subunit K